MKVRMLKKENENGRKYIEVNFTEHKATFFTGSIDITHQNNLQSKLKIVDEYLCSISPKYEHKEILFAWGKVDEQVSNYYKKVYPKGGKRINAGRKVGYKSNKPKSERTERFTQAITLEEKVYLIEKLNEFRLKQNN